VKYQYSKFAQTEGTAMRDQKHTQWRECNHGTGAATRPKRPATNSILNMTNEDQSLVNHNIIHQLAVPNVWNSLLTDAHNGCLSNFNRSVSKQTEDTIFTADYTW